ncbi:MAG: UDP-N-acetylmuramoyl-L-alanine--D-glutamate ligase [Prevotella sp.]|nr:UDP-N-acetylmuramoyl-L-alanine--D-glutamate ligase [Prevotella sp.]
MKKIAVLGGGESGAGVALLARKEGYDVFVSDSGRIQDKYKSLLNEHNIDWEEGSHDAGSILAADEIMKSPGVPDTAPIIKSVIEKGLPVISEPEFCSRFIRRGKTICVTGSNGKTTTTTLIYDIMRRSGRTVALGGNIGKSLAMQLVAGECDWYVLELSSFQLDNCYDFRADIAVLMNITPDHLDRYDFRMQNYINSKMRIMQNQTPADSFIYWADDEYVPRELERRRSGETIEKPVPSSREAKPGHPALLPFTDDDFTRLGLETHLFGNHNRRNAVAAYLATRAAGVGENVVKQAIKEFKGVEHRLEYVVTKSGIDFINDSKATNVDACRVALEAMTRPTVLILGGTDKGNDYDVIMPLVKEKCRAVVFLGADNTKLHTCFDGAGLPVADTHSMRECVAACRRVAQAGDTVLLSPCCASFDLFKNMEDRGEQFVLCVNEL